MYIYIYIYNVYLRNYNIYNVHTCHHYYIQIGGNTFFMFASIAFLFDCQGPTTTHDAQQSGGCASAHLSYKPTPSAIGLEIATISCQEQHEILARDNS